MNKFTSVLFDFDGTIANTAADVWASVDYGFDRCGYYLPKSFSRDNRNLALPIDEMAKRLYPGISESDCRRIRGSVNNHYRYVTSYDKTVLYDGIAELLGFLKNKSIPTGILSNKGHMSLGRILEKKGWGWYFDDYCGAKDSEGDVTTKEERLKRFSSGFDTTRCVYIGDTAWDVTAAKQNGFMSVGVLYGDGDRDELLLQKPDVVCETSRELRDYFIGELDTNA